MLNLSTKEYDLNALFSFESLKEILLELAKSQIKLENEMKNIHEENKKRDKKIINIQKIIRNFNVNENEKFNINFINEEEKDENNNEDIKNNEETEEKEENDENEENEDNNEINSPKNIEIDKTEKKEEKEGVNNQVDNKKFDSENNRNMKINNSSIKKVEYVNIYSNNKKNNIQFQKLDKQIKELISKISILEEKIKNETKNKKKDEEKMRNISSENKEELKKLNDKINSLNSKRDDIEQKIESMQSSIKGLDIMAMFKDNGSGTIDATKVMVKSLQEKVFKKFELVETRYKKEMGENSKTKALLENLVPKIEKINQDLEKISESNNEQKEELDIYIKTNEEKNNETKNNIYEDFNNKLEKFKEEIKTDMKNLINPIEKKLDNFNSPEFFQNNNLSENIKILEKKFSDLRKKTNDMDNTLKFYLKRNDIDIIKKELKDLKSSIESKLTKEDIKELYNFHLTDLDEINDIKDRFDLNREEIAKINKDIRTAMQKIEIFQGNLILLQNSKGQPGLNKIIDFSKYVEHSKLNDALNPIIKQIENILKEIESIRRDMNEIELKNKKYNTNALSQFEEDNTNKMNELKVLIQKKYLEKYDFNRIIKTIEVQIKSLTDDSKRADADTWLLAKKNTKCFNCATCEANIKNDNYTTADYLAWKKYPKGEKIHRMGQGFSHMLEMMSSEFAKSIERNDFPDENTNIYLNSDSYINTVPNINERASSTKLKFNKKELAQEENLQNPRGSKKSGKMKLPKMIPSKIKLKKNEGISINANQNSDDENNKSSDGNNIINIVNSLNNEKEEIQNQNIDDSPKIMKIVKKTKNDLVSNNNDNFKTIKEERDRIDKDNDF